MRVLVSGATSLLGRHVAQQLIGRGDQVTVLQRGASGIDAVELRGDICNERTVATAVRGQQAVIHLAAKVSVTGDWDSFERANVQGTQTLLTAAKAAGVERFVHVSSPSVAHSGHPLVGAGADPAEPDQARGHYAHSKALAELIALSANSSTFSVVAVRPHLVWGPGDTQLVGRIVDRARSGRLVLVGGGHALIDTTYIDNAATALVAAADCASTVGGEAFVVSNGEPRTVAELVTRICRATGVPAPSRSVPPVLARTAGSVVEQAWSRLRRDDEPPLTRFLAEQLATAHWFDQRRTRQALNWTPHVSLADGFDRLANAAPS
jgi:2-alkyl-3-oxoalkanoate reductase